MKVEQFYHQRMREKMIWEMKPQQVIQHKQQPVAILYYLLNRCQILFIHREHLQHMLILIFFVRQWQVMHHKYASLEQVFMKLNHGERQHFELMQVKQVCIENQNFIPFDLLCRSRFAFSWSLFFSWSM